MLTAPIRWQFHPLATILVAALLLPPAADAQHTSGKDPVPRLSIEQVQQVVATHFSSQASHRPGDLISQADVAAILKQLAEAGWQPVDQKSIIADTLPDANALVGLLRTHQGRKFMQKVSSFELIYDRMDRLSQVSGGQRTLDALARLPDGEKYAKPKKELPYGVPDFLYLLPKNASGRVRTIKDYDKPTGRIYTEADLLRRLTRSWQGEVPPEPRT